MLTRYRGAMSETLPISTDLVNAVFNDQGTIELGQAFTHVLTAVILLEMRIEGVTELPQEISAKLGEIEEN